MIPSTKTKGNVAVVGMFGIFALLFLWSQFRLTIEAVPATTTATTIQDEPILLHTSTTAGSTSTTTTASFASHTTNTTSQAKGFTPHSKLTVPIISSRQNITTVKVTKVATNNNTSTTTATTTIRFKKNKMQKKKNLYFCGYPVDALGVALFPDYENQGRMRRSSYQTLNYTQEDVVVWGMHRPCPVFFTEPTWFPGKILAINGESTGDVRTMTNATLQRNNQLCQIGNVPDSDQTILVYYFVMALYLLLYKVEDDGHDSIHNSNNNATMSLFGSILDPTQKPVTTGRYKAMIYIQRKCIDYREAAVVKIADILPVHYGSACKGQNTPHKNILPMPSPIPKTGGWTIVRDHVQEYMFCMAMEHENSPYYLTEKLLNAFLAGCIPIFYGTRGVFDVINPRAFVYYDIDNPGPALQQLAFLVNNETAYWEMLRQEPILAHGNDTIEKFFSLAKDVGNGHLQKKIRSVMGL